MLSRGAGWVSFHAQLVLYAPCKDLKKINDFLCTSQRHLAALTAPSKNKRRKLKKARNPMAFRPSAQAFRPLPQVLHTLHRAAYIGLVLFELTRLKMGHIPYVFCAAFR